jgi:hypothetical protein
MRIIKMKKLLQYYYERPLLGLAALAVTAVSLVEGGINIAKNVQYDTEYDNCVANQNSTLPGRNLFVERTYNDEGNDPCVKACSYLCDAAANSGAVVLLCVLGLGGVLSPALSDVKEVVSKKGVELGLWKRKPEQKGLLNGDGNSTYGSDVVATVPEEVSTSEKDLEAGYSDKVEDGVSRSLRYS